MEYAGSYALFNYRLVDPAKGLEYDNLRLIRAFEAGLDPSSSEAGFVLVHIAMVKESGALVSGAASMLDACAARDRERFDDGLRTLVAGLSKVNSVMHSESMPSELKVDVDTYQQCGSAASPTATPASALSSLASPHSQCFPMESSTRV